MVLWVQVGLQNARGLSTGANRVHPCHTLSERNELSIVAILEDT